MKKAFSIAQWLYVRNSALPQEAADGLHPNKIQRIGDDIKIKLASGDDETISEQYDIYKDDLREIIAAIATSGDDQVVLSVCIKAYEYIPEISIPSELVKALSAIDITIDIDVISMIDSCQL